MNDFYVTDDDCFVLMHELINHFYEKIVLKEDKGDNKYDKYMTDDFRKTVTRLMEQVRNLYALCKEKDLDIRYCGIMCRRHINAINRKYDLGFKSMKEKYLIISESVIVKHKNIRRLISVAALHRFYVLIYMIKDDCVFECSDCKVSLETNVSDKYRIVDKGFCLCTSCEKIVCKKCIDKHS